MDIENNIESYINMETNIPKKKGLLSLWWIMLIVCIPSALFGAYSNISKPIMLPLIIIMSFWIIYLLINTESKKMQYILFLGIYSIFISISFLTASYKIAATKINVSVGYILIILFVYILTIFLSIFNTLRLIRKGYFQKQKKMDNPMGIIIASELFGLGVGRVLLNKINQDTVVAILAMVLILLGFLYLSGVHNILKFYFIRKKLNTDGHEFKT
ncbi:MAG: hypothetical protein ACYCYI_05690 [Saccharofermentanales bacterium]